MSFPLYDVIQQAEPHLTNTSHYGLWFERFFNQYDRENSNEHKRWLILEPHKDKKKNEDEPRGKAYWLNTFAGKKLLLIRKEKTHYNTIRKIKSHW